MRVLTHAEIMQKALAEYKKEQGDLKLKRKKFKVYSLFAPLHGMSLREFKDHWYAVDNPETNIEGYLADIDGGPIKRLRVYPGQIASVAHLLRPDLATSPLWDFFIKAWESCDGEPIVAFDVKGYKHPFILTNDNTKNQTKIFHPRIKIPVNGTSNDIYIYTWETWLKENERT